LRKKEENLAAQTVVATAIWKGARALYSIE
jgi:hypothetical protein